MKNQRIRKWDYMDEYGACSCPPEITTHSKPQKNPMGGFINKFKCMACEKIQYTHTTLPDPGWAKEYNMPEAELSGPAC